MYQVHTNSWETMSRGHSRNRSLDLRQPVEAYMTSSTMISMIGYVQQGKGDINNHFE